MLTEHSGENILPVEKFKLKGEMLLVFTDRQLLFQQPLHKVFGHRMEPLGNIWVFKSEIRQNYGLLPPTWENAVSVDKFLQGTG